MKTKYIILLTILFCYFFTSCKKEWLDKKPNSSLVVPSTLQDFQALLDNPSYISNSISLNEIGSDNYYISQSRLLAIDNLSQTSYMWAADGWGANRDIFDWSTSYRYVNAANIVLSGLAKVDLKDDNRDSWNNINGSALFFRALAFYNLSQIFCKPFRISSADGDLGVPLRLESNINQKVGRGTVKQTYDQIVRDLITAKQLLPQNPAYKFRPSKAAVDGLLARIYLSMGIYDKALAFSDSCLSYNSFLIDFNTLSSAAPPFPQYYDNKEIVMYIPLISSSALSRSTAIIDTTLYASYDIDDLRKTKFYGLRSGALVWQGNYSGTLNQLDCSIASDEMFLIRSECYARMGDMVKALQDLNTLMSKRWKSSTFTPITAINANDALNKILKERRKELVMRGLRWSDLRRLNLDPANATTITRSFNGMIFTLAPGDNKYVWPIPDNEILYSGIQQNPR